MNDAALLGDLEPRAAELLERHLKSAKEWFPHMYIPWERGVKLNVHEDWDPNEFPLPDSVRSSLFVNLLTEDNLPYYHYGLAKRFGNKGSAFSEWNRRWTAEEERHSIVIRDYLIVSQAIDPIALERARMEQVSKGVVPDPIGGAVGAIAYVSMQELATRISHRNTGKLVQDPAGYEVMSRVASDENLHFLFYRDLMSAVIEIDPSAAVLALEREVREFQMPGTGIPGFKKHAVAIANEGIYSLAVHHDLILQPVVMRHYKIETLEGLTPEAEEARKNLIDRVNRIGKAGRIQLERQAAQSSKAAQSNKSAS